jgi:hypothetical protein
MIMKNFTLLILIIISRFSYAQVGIGTTNPEATLEIKASTPSNPSNTDGILVPRVDTFPTTNPTASQNGMLVFLTTALPNFPVGFYYWDNSSTNWMRMDTGENYWKLSGNSGTHNGTDFIGTTDANSLDIRVNNVIQARITNKGQIETLNNGESVFIGEGAGEANQLGNTEQNVFVGYQAGFSNNHGDRNTAIGYKVLYHNSHGSDNTAMGYNALFSNLGNKNVAMGSNALYNNVGGSYNVANGYNTLFNNNGSHNTAVGAEALEQNTSGSNNIALGYRAGANITTGSHNIIIGNDIEAPSATDDNQLNIGNVIYATGVDGTGINPSSGNVGISIPDPVEKLDINGAIKIQSTSSTNAGTIRWNGYDFEGYDGNEWLSLTRINSVWGNVIPQSEENQSITGSDTTAGDQFGFSVGISGDYAVIGAPNADISGNSNQGAAYIFKRDGDTWSQEAKITANDGAADDQFGCSVAISDDSTNNVTYVIIGAYSDDITHSNQGSAYIFTRSGTTWSQYKIYANDGSTGDQFGYAVSITNTYAAIGANYADISGNSYQGAAYVFNYDGSTWAQQQKIVASDGMSFDNFGNSISICNHYDDTNIDYVLVGSPKSDISTNNDQGAAYLYKRSGTTWSSELKIKNTDGEAGDMFGISVSATSTIGAPVCAIIGAYARDIGSNTNQGAAYIVEASVAGEAVTNFIEIYDVNGKTGDHFGNAVSIFRYSYDYYGNNINNSICGVYNDDISANIDQGSSNIYSINDGDPKLETKVTASDGTASDYFGNSVSISKDYALIGAPRKEQAYFIKK